VIRINHQFSYKHMLATTSLGLKTAQLIAELMNYRNFSPILPQTTIHTRVKDRENHGFVSGKGTRREKEALSTRLTGRFVVATPAAGH